MVKACGRGQAEKALLRRALVGAWDAASLLERFSASIYQ